MTDTPVCERCESLKRDRKICFESWLTQRAVNQESRLTGKAAREELKRYEREYQKAEARLRLHEAVDHPEKGRTTSIQDINLVYR
jgi:hypothetical protein